MATRSAAVSRRGVFAVCVLLALVAAVWIYLSPFGEWLQTLAGSVRWENAYTALDTAEANLPRDARERDRLLLANAMAEGEPPVGLQAGARLHPPGTLARLRYELFDENGEPYETREVRALVPSIGNGQGPFWREPCGRSCRDRIARSSGTRIRRSGEPGIAEEYVLRMPVGKSFELKPTPLRMQDILDERPRELPLRSVQAGARTVPVPSRILVTLVSACAGDVRVGSTTDLQFADNATVAIPNGLRRSRWVELDGCGKLEPLEPALRESPVAKLRVQVEPPDLHAIVPYRDQRSGAAALLVDEAWLKRYNGAVMFHINRACRYDADADRWRTLPLSDAHMSWRVEPVSAAEAARGNRTAYEAPKETGLYWIHWSEGLEGTAPLRRLVYRHAFLPAGGMLCNDVMAGEAPKDKVAACVPFHDRAEVRFVTNPLHACAQ